MILVDSLIIGGIEFVLDKIATAVDQELHDDSNLRQELLAAQMRLELGEISEDEFRRIEAELLSLIRVIRERNDADAEEGEYKIAGAEVTFGGDER